MTVETQTTIGVVVSIVAIFLTLWKILIEKNDKQLSIILSVGQLINNSKNDLDKVQLEAIEFTRSKKQIPPKLQANFDIAVENYLNSIEKLCNLFYKKHIKESKWKIEYREIIFDAVDNFEEKFGAATRYVNTKKIYNKWKLE